MSAIHLAAIVNAGILYQQALQAHGERNVGAIRNAESF